MRLMRVLRWGRVSHSALRLGRALDIALVTKPRAGVLQWRKQFKLSSICTNKHWSRFCNNELNTKTNWTQLTHILLDNKHLFHLHTWCVTNDSCCWMHRLWRFSSDYFDGWLQFLSDCAICYGKRCVKYHSYLCLQFFTHLDLMVLLFCYFNVLFI